MENVTGLRLRSWVWVFGDRCVKLVTCVVLNCKKQLCLALVMYHLFELAADGNEQYIGFYRGASRLGDDLRAGAVGLDFLVKLNYSVQIMVKAL